jgi:signal transduction histidine kinase
MGLPSPDPLTLLAQAFDATTAALRQSADPAERATRLAGVVRALWPPAAASLCRLTEGGRDHLAVAAEGGRPEDGAPAFPPEAPAGCRWLLQEVGRPARAVVGLALPAGAGPAEGSPRELLAAYARELGLQLAAEADRHALAEREETLSELSWSADVGALAGPITHEFNNFLNVILLQVAVLEQELPEYRRRESTVIRQQGKSVAELIRQWQQYRQRQPVLQPVDLNRVARQAVEALCREQPAFGVLPIRLAPAGGDGQPAAAEAGAWVRLELAPRLPPVSGTALDVQRLVRFLVANAAAAILSPPGLVTVRTGTADGKVVLQVEDNGPPALPARLAEFFEPSVILREGANRLELATCKTLAHRRMQGTIQAANRPEGGVAVTVTLRPWG